MLKIAQFYKKHITQFELDLRSLAVFRILLAIIILSDLYVRATQMEMFYTDSGVFPVRFVLYSTMSFHTWSGDLDFQIYLFWVAAFFALLLLLGFKTTFTLAVSWLFLLSLDLRNPVVLNAGDKLLRMLLLISVFLPLGKRFSLDAFFNKSYQFSPNKYSSIWALIYHIQLILVYAISGFSKLNMTWLSGNGIYYAMKIHTYAKPSAAFFLAYPILGKLLSFYTLILECFGTALFFIKRNKTQFRLLIVFLFVFFHFGLFLFMEIGLFPWIGMVAWIPIIPTVFWDKIYSYLKIKMYSKPSSFIRHIYSFKTKIVTATGILFIALMIYSNLMGIPQFPRIKIVDRFVKSVLLKQGWTLFSNPEKNDGWYVAETLLYNGKKINLLKPEMELTWERPILVSAEYKTHKERKYMRRLHQSYEGYGSLLLKYLSNKWNESHSANEQVVSSKLIYMEETTLPDNKYSEVKKNEVGEVKFKK